MDMHGRGYMRWDTVFSQSKLRFLKYYFIKKYVNI